MLDDYTSGIDTTGSVLVNGTATGIIETSDDTDWFAVSLDAGTTYLLDMYGRYFGGGSLAAPSLSIYSQSGQFLDKVSDGVTSGSTEMGFTPTVTGTYYLSASSAMQGGIGSYTVKVTKSNSIDDFRGDVGTTGSIAVGGSVTGNIEVLRDTDWFSIQLIAGTTYRFDMSGRPSGGGTLASPYLKIYSETGQVIDSAYGGGGNGETEMTFTATTSGTYFLGASSLLPGYTGTYSITATPSGGSLPTVSFATLSAGKTEGNSGSAPFTFTVVRSGDTSSTSVVSYEVLSAGTNGATADDFFAANGSFPSGSVTFAPGVTTQTLTIEVAGDTTVEPDEQFSVVLRNATGATLGANHIATATVRNDDGPGKVAHPQTDFDGNGKADLVWQSASGGLTLWSMNGATATATVMGDAGSTDWQPAGFKDFSGDGNADILWRSQSAGIMSLWTMNGSGGVAAVNAVGDPGSTDWQIVAAQDFTGDGQTDILWRSASAGNMSLWTMNGTSVSAVNAVGDPGSTDWQIAAVGDFSGDGQPDILWRSASAGNMSLWTMNGTQVSAVSVVGDPGSTDWQIAGTADFNGDGNTDILWRSASTGHMSLWELNGTSVSTVAPMSDPGSTAWQVAKLDDYNGDGQTDILWKNQTSGGLSLWTMNGTSVQSTASLSATPGTGWSLL